MTLIETLREIKYQVADKLFCKEMDEAFQMGVREGATFATRMISTDLSVKEMRIQMTKTEKKGYQKAQDLVADCRKEIKSQTGAQFL